MSGLPSLRKMTLDDWKNVATMIGVAITALALSKAVIEYRDQGKQSRMEQFQAMRKRLKENDAFKAILTNVDICVSDPESAAGKDAARFLEDPKLWGDKRDLMGFFEEIAIMTDSGMISRDLAHYFFGYYAIECSECPAFIGDLNEESNYWAIFWHFTRQMKEVKNSPSFKRLAETRPFPKDRFTF